jgi:SNF-related kinase
MIVREPEKRATLDEVMSDIWYRQCEEEDDADDDDDDQNDIESLRLISEDDHKSILHQMIKGNIAEQEAILKALNEDQYNHITATYYLLAEKILHDKIDNHDQNIKRQRRLLQPASTSFTEQIGAFISSSSK